MAARKSRHVPNRESAPVSEGDQSPMVATISNQDGTRPIPRSPLLAVSLVIFLVWAASLMTMAVIVETPPTLNITQIRKAELIVQGQIDPTEQGVFLVDRSWPADASDVVVMIEDLGDLSLNPKESYLIPLERTNDSAYRVVLTPPPAEIGLAYPANDATIAALEALLGDER